MVYHYVLYVDDSDYYYPPGEWLGPSVKWVMCILTQIALSFIRLIMSIKSGQLISQHYSILIPRCPGVRFEAKSTATLLTAPMIVMQIPHNLISLACYITRLFEILALHNGVHRAIVPPLCATF